MTMLYDHSEKAAKALIARLGKEIVIGVPLGLGKPNGLLNALYKLASKDQTLKLRIITGLTLASPLCSNDLEKRLLEPILDRMLQDYEEPLYEKPRRLQKLPTNIQVMEFFLSPGTYLGNASVQQDYISSNYTSVVDDAISYSINVFAQTVAPSPTDPQLYSLSCNSDLFHEAVLHLQKAARNNKKIAIVAEVNARLPYMLGEDAVVSSEIFTEIVDTGNYRTLFPLPREELSAQDHLMGLYTSCLIKDDSCIQIGIGKLNNAITSALLLRHKENQEYCALLQKLSINDKFSDVVASVGSLGVFDRGLYASTEMFSDDYLHLYKEAILKKQVYDHVGLQELLNQREITEEVTPLLLETLLEKGLINSQLSASDFAFLLRFGIFKPGLTYDRGVLILSTKESIPADLVSPKAKKRILENCLGDRLKTGKILHAGFFIGTEDFYQALTHFPQAELEKFSMTSVARTNALSWSYDLAKAQRQQARFINFSMMLTLGGNVISDGLSNLQEVSGVGGQFNFVNMARSLPGARSIIVCRSVRTSKKGLESNILWEYPNVTLPRHLRDIFVTEYGIADCRSKTDSEVIKAILNISDSRFQERLLQEAKKAGKLSQAYEIPKAFKNNYPEVVEAIIEEVQKKGYCQSYPFGSDLTEEEIVLSRALLFLKACTPFKLFYLSLKALLSYQADKPYKPYLKRMKLEHPKNVKAYFFKKLLKCSLRKVI